MLRPIAIDPFNVTIRRTYVCESLLVVHPAVRFVEAAFVAVRARASQVELAHLPAAASRARVNENGKTR